MRGENHCTDSVFPRAAFDICAKALSRSAGRAARFPSRFYREGTSLRPRPRPPRHTVARLCSGTPLSASYPRAEKACGDNNERYVTRETRRPPRGNSNVRVSRVRRPVYLREKYVQFERKAHRASARNYRIFKTSSFGETDCGETYYINVDRDLFIVLDQK